ncbi:hypothetical protein C8N36_12448 [Pelagimonas varians]|uniref:Uncharacterized protein n=1 Tax=Pelagimonas varians TaxID=696760 RepID=A0A238L619_9RHOB|nr:hypothetical protein C8N36_12448 [Pelagimonas varians]SMX49832.1 hypothetical protein PEV8663_04349 [Pelagimonas varians]
MNRSNAAPLFAWESPRCSVRYPGEVGIGPFALQLEILKSMSQLRRNRPAESTHKARLNGDAPGAVSIN